MAQERRTKLDRWCGLAAAASLLVLCLVLLSSQAVTAESAPPAGPSPSHEIETAGPTSPVTPASDSMPLPTTSRMAPVVPAAARNDNLASALPWARWTGEGAPVFAPAGALLPGLAAMTPPLPSNTDLAVCTTTDRVWGLVGAGETVTVTVDGEQMGAALADGNGFFWTTLYDGNGDRPNLSAGSMVTICHDGVQPVSVTLGSITGGIDMVDDVVSGTIGGVAAPISVTVYAPWGEPSMTSYSQTVNSDGSGSFQADFKGVWDFTPAEEATVAYVANGVEVHRHVYGRDGLLVRPAPFNYLRGHADPGSTVTATLYVSPTWTERGSQPLTADATSGLYEWSVPTDVLPSNVVVVTLANNTVLSRTVYTFSMAIDPAQDRVTGQAEPGRVVRGVASELAEAGWRDRWVTATVEASGAYTLDFGSLVDIMPGTWTGVYVADAQGEDLNLWGIAASVEVNQTWNEVSGRGPFSPGPAAEGRAVTLTLASTSTTYSTALDWWDWYGFNEEDHGLPDIQAGEVVTVRVEGSAWQGAVRVQTMTVEADLDVDQFSGTVVPPSDRVELWGSQWAGDLYPVAGTFNTPATASSPFVAAPPGFDVRNSLDYDLAHRTADEYLERISAKTWGIGVVLRKNEVEANIIAPGVAYTITLYDGSGDVKAELTGASDEPIGSLGRDFWEADRQIQAGDRVQVRSDNGFSQTLVIPDLAIVPDEGADVIRGQAPANAQLSLEVSNQGRGFVSADGSGKFVVSVGQLQQVDGDGDLQWGDDIHLRYSDRNNNWVEDDFFWPALVAHYQADGWNEVYGWEAPPGETIYVTVAHPAEGIVYTATTTAGACDWCGSTEYQVVPPGGIITPSNTVSVYFGSGLQRSTTVFDVAGQADPETDVVTITTNAPSGTWVWMDVDGPNAWWGTVSGQVAAGGIVTFDLTADYDVVLGTNFYVYVEDETATYTRYTFWLPAPELWIDKWTTGGHARPGGVVVYGIEYQNDGNGVATDTLIVDTLPLSTTYAGDTSGIAPIQSAGVVTWNLGSLAPGDYGAFMVTLNVSPSVPTGTEVITSNCALITTTTPGDYDPGNNSTCSGPMSVREDDAGVNVDKWPNPGDPTPGQEFEYDVRWCSDRGAAAGAVWLTDTLPLSTTLLSWRPQNSSERYWTEVVTSDGQLVLYAPGLPGDRCEDLYLRLLLDPGAQISTTLENTVVITTSGDVEPGNNGPVNSDVHVSPPRYDMNTEKWFNSGALVPGGGIAYGVNWWNAGNIATHAWITDVLPSGTTYQPGSGRYHNGQPAEPAAVTDDWVVWDLGVVEVQDGFGLDFRLDVSSTVPTDTVLNNCVTVGITANEDTPWDNTACVSETIREPGPNLRVLKSSQWNGDGQLGYQVRFLNIGSERIDDVRITDTLPISTSWDGWWDMNFEGERLISTTQSSDQLRWEFSELYPGDSGELYFNAKLDDPGARPRWYTNTIQITTVPGDTDPGDNTYEDVVVKPEVERVELEVAREGSGMWGQAQPDAPITVTIGISDFAGWVDGGGNWNIDSLPAVNPGESFTVRAGNGSLPVAITVPDPFTAEVSSSQDRVWGQIEGWANQGVEVYGGWPGGYRDVQTDNAGNYLAPYMDVPRGAEGYVRIETEIGYATVVFHRHFKSPDLLIQVNYADDWVEGDYEAGHTVWLTVTHGGGEETATGTTGPIPWWGDRSGLSTNYNVAWAGDSPPDIQPGDWVYGLVQSDAYTTSVHVGTITGTLNITDDTVSGNIYADWFTETLYGQCGVWQENGPGRDFTVKPNGGSYFCDFSSDWDLLPGQTVGVGYQEPDGDWVFNAFHEPIADVAIDKSGQGQPAPGGNYIYRINTHNYGDGDAHNVVISDTLPGEMAYLSDDSGLPCPACTPGATGTLTWTLDSLGGQIDSFFDVVVSVTDTVVPGTLITNTVQITTTDYDSDGGNNERRLGVEVAANDSRLNIGKWSWTDDPSPDTDVVFTVNVCNNGSTASSQVILTDTLYPPLTLQTWWSDDPGWNEVYTDAQRFVLSYPSLSSGTCQAAYLRAHLDGEAAPGNWISNTAVITASTDIGDENQTTWWGQVGEAHTNLGIYKSWNGGQLVAGGELRYNIHYQNDGNVPVGSTLRITDTLPASTTFVGWSFSDGPSAPSLVVSDTDRVVWQVNGLDNGYWGDFEVVLKVDDGAEPGTVLTNTAQISQIEGEDRYEDNSSTWVEHVYPGGPNLRVRKDGYWHDWGENTRQAQYDVTFENVGSERVDWVTITDHYPDSMYMNSGIGLDPGRWWEWGDDPAHHAVTLTLEYLDSGESFGFSFTIITDTDPIPSGLILTNTVDVTPADSHPEDNVDDFVLTTGPDLYVRKKLLGGEVLPGETITLGLLFGNDRYCQERWWSTKGTVWVTDTLPAELEFVTSTLRSWSWSPIQPHQQGNQVGWELWPFDSCYQDEILVTARVTDTVEATDVFTNWVRIQTDQPISDTEPYYDDNEAHYEMLVVQPRFEMTKTFTSSQVAGTVMTYTVTVTNTGNQDATGVVLSDTLPAGLLFGGSDGRFDGKTITWTLEITAPYGTASGWFSATLPCTASQAITNDRYGVVKSDQGVAGSLGDAVVFETVSPTIQVELTHTLGAIVVSDTIHFTATVHTTGTPLGYQWNFGQGPEAGDLTASHVYTVPGSYTIAFTTTDGCGFFEVATATVSVSAPGLVARFSPSAANVVAGTTVHFTDQSTSGPPTTQSGIEAPPIMHWLWDFGDGSPPVTVQHPDHMYVTVGTHTVTLIVTDALGYSDDETSKVTVRAPKLVAGFDYSPKPAHILVGDEVNFTDQSTSDGPAITDYGWGFGDGGTSTLDNPSHTYTKVGTYTVSLVVTDALGFSDDEVKTDLVVVAAACTALTGASLTYEPDAPAIGTPVLLAASYQPTDATTPVSYEWDFGDGETATVATAEVQHTYATKGTKVVKVTIKSSCTPAGVSAQKSLDVAGPRVYLPIVLKNR